MKISARIACLAFVSVLFVSPVTAQVFNKSRGIFDKSNKKMVQQLIDKNTTVFTSGKGPYAARLKEAFNSYWKINPFQFTDEIKKPIEANSAVLKPVIITTINGRGNETSQNYPFYVYAQADKDGEIMMESVIAAVPVTFYYEFDVLADSNMYNRSLLRIPYMVRTLNEMLSYIKVHGDDKGYYDSVDARSARIGAKTLIIPSDLVKEWDVNPNMTGLMKSIEKGRKPMKAIMYNILEESAISYAGKYKIMSNEEIMKLEKSADADKYALFLPAIDDKKYIEVYDLKTKELLYFEETTMSVKIKSKDFDKLNKAAGF